MVTTLDKLTQDGCSTDDKHKVCRSRGGESCAFDGAMIVLQPIADTAHIVHGPIACCGNSWEGRGTQSTHGDLHRRGFTTDMGEIDIVYGSEDKLMDAITRTADAVHPKAIFVYATCVSGLIGEDIDSVCRRAESKFGIPVIPVNAPGFVGPKNLGNRIAGEALLEKVIGTGEPAVTTHYDINLIGEYNIAGDLWLLEPLLTKAGIRVLSRITGDSTFEEITHAHRAKLNVVVCGRALINVAREMERRYGIPFVEASFFGSTEIAKALRLIAGKLQGPGDDGFVETVEALIRSEEKKLKATLKPYEHLRGRKAVLYSGGVKSWSFISTLMDLGIEVVAIGTKKSTYEDEEKMKQLLGPDAPLVEDVAPKKLLRLLKERNADMLIAGGRNQYLAVKEGYPFVDVNQERHTPYAGYAGLVNLAEQISNSVRFYRGSAEFGMQRSEWNGKSTQEPASNSTFRTQHSALRIDPLKHSPALGAAIAFQGVHRALPVIHGAQGCGFLGKVLLTRHFREPVALATTKLFVEDVVMGSEEKLVHTAQGFIDKNQPEVLGILTSGLSEVKGDDTAAAVLELATQNSPREIVHVPTPDYTGGLEQGYARAVEAMLGIVGNGVRHADGKRINVIVGPHLSPGDVTELRDSIESFGMRAVILPDLSALDGSRQVFSPLAEGGTTVEEIRSMINAVYTLAVGMSMEPAATMLEKRFGIGYRVFDSIAGMEGTDALIDTLLKISGMPIPARYDRQRKILIDTMRDAHAVFGGKRIAIALEPDLAAQVSTVLEEMGARLELAVIPTLADAADRIRATEVAIGDLHVIDKKYDLLISNSHAEDRAKKFSMPLYQLGFPAYKVFGNTTKVTIGYRGAVTMMNEMANLMMENH